MVEFKDVWLKDLITQRSKWAFFAKKQNEFFGHFEQMYQRWVTMEKTLAYMKKTKEKALDLNRLKYY